MAAQIMEVSVKKDELLSKIQGLAEAKARLITMTCTDFGNFFEVIYHFDEDSKIMNVKTKIGKNETLPSITNIFPYAFLAENEVKDMFRMNFSGLGADFDGRLLRTADSIQTTLLKPLEGISPPMFRVEGRCAYQCPALIDVPRYIRQIAEGKYKEAFQTILEVAPFPAILGRVCYAPCENICRRSKECRPLSIRLLKRFVADQVDVKKFNVTKLDSTGKRIAVIGAGPAGLTCAYYLGLLGHEVTVFDELSRAGGMMLTGIPGYRLPKNLMGTEINARMDEAGVKLKLGIRIENLGELLGEGFHAIFVATGAHKGMKLGIEGEEHPQVIDCLKMLREVNLQGWKSKTGKKVAIIGGGNSAIDAARVARRLGAEDVSIFYRRTRKEMPATPREIEEAESEGVKLEFLVAPMKVQAGKTGAKMEFIRMKLGAPDTSGRPRPEPISGSEFTVEADIFVKAVGQMVIVPEGFDLKLNRRGQIEVHPETFETSKQGVFAGGDVVTGPASVTEAIGTGWKAASAIDKYLDGKGLEEHRLLDELIVKPDKEEVSGLDRIPVTMIPVEERIKSFDEVELGYSEKDAVEEAKRCWKCDWNE